MSTTPARRRTWFPVGAAVLGLILAVALAETVLRVGIAAGPLRDPGLFADQLTDDEFWRLNAAWVREGKPLAAAYRHAEIGWALAKTKQNPLGVITQETHYTPLAGPTVVPCFGDSFMAGEVEVPIRERLPDQLAARLPGLTFYNFGLGGYGLDQIYMRFRAEVPELQPSVAIVGVLTSDLDRSALTIRGGPKPHFILGEGGELMLVPPDRPESFPGAHPPQTWSYFARLLRRAARNVLTGVRGQHTYGRAHKEKLNRAILEALVEDARSNNVQLLFVAFYTPEELFTETWQEIFLQKNLEELGVELFDTKPLLLQASKLIGRDPRKFYLLPGNGHPNAEAYSLMADSLSDLIAERLHP